MFQKYELGNNRYVSVSNFKGKTYVHVRVHDEMQGYPTKVGVALNPSRFAILTLAEDDIAEKVNQLNKPEEFDYKTHLGGGVYCTVRSGCCSVHLRKYFVPHDKMYPIPTKKGISLRIEEWRKLLIHLKTIREEFPELAQATPCHFDTFHQNQEAAFSCVECYPFGANGVYL